MDIEAIFQDKALKSAERTHLLSAMVLDGRVRAADMIAFAAKSKDPDKATCMEAFEYATKAQPKIANPAIFDFASAHLGSKAPRLKWESAKVIGNIATLFPDLLGLAVPGLMANTRHDGTVVRWSAAYALGEILKLGTAHNAEILPAVKAIIGSEEKNSIQKIYQAALKKLPKE